MNYRFEISSEDYPDFKCEIAVGRDQNFLMFHETIVDVLGYDSTQLASFFTLDATGERVKEIALMDMSDGSEYAVLVMDQTLIGDAINSKCLELEYVYDFFENRSLRIEYAGEYIADSGDVLPKLISCTGEMPKQFEFESEGGWIPMMRRTILNALIWMNFQETVTMREKKDSGMRSTGIGMMNPMPAEEGGMLNTII